MTPEQQAAYVNAMAACASLIGAAMTTENYVASRAGKPLPHNGDAFRALLNEYGIHHNAVLLLFHGGA